MSIKGTIDELDNVKAEIGRNNFRNKILRQRKKVLENHISAYLRSKNQTGVKYKGRSIILEAKEKRSTKRKDVKERDVVTLLRELGVDNPHEAYTQIQDVQKGEPVEQYHLKIKKINKGRGQF